jgi:hypothetical protein
MMWFPLQEPPRRRLESKKPKEPQMIKILVIFDGTWMGTLSGTCSTASSHNLHALFIDHRMKSLFIQPFKKKLLFDLSTYLL